MLYVFYYIFILYQVVNIVLVKAMVITPNYYCCLYFRKARKYYEFHRNRNAGLARKSDQRRTTFTLDRMNCN